MSAVQHQPSGAAFDVVLLLHVGCVVTGLATTAAATATARRLSRLLLGRMPVSEALRRYFQPGVNWAGRTVYGIPVFGFALLAMSRGVYALGDGWVLAGLVLFIALVWVCEGVLWPAERRVQAGLQSCVPLEGAAVAGDACAGDACAGDADDADADDVTVNDAKGGSVARDAGLMTRAGIVALVLLVAGSIVMVAQP